MNPVFLSDGGLGVRIDATDTSQRIKLVGDGDSVVVSHVKGSVVHVRIGQDTVAATTSCYPIIRGTKEDEIMLKGPGSQPGLIFPGGTWIAAICELGQTGSIVVNRVSR